MTIEILRPVVSSELFDGPAGTAGEREFLERALDAWARACRVVGAVAYLGTDTGLERPVASSERAGKLPTGAECLRLALGAGHVEYGRGDETPDPEAVRQLTETALLAVALRMYSLREEIRTRDFHAKYRGVELEALYDVGLAISSTLDLRELTEEILHRAVSLLDARRGALYLASDDGYRLRGAVGGDAPEVLEAVSAQSASLSGAQHVLAEIILVEGQPRGLLVVADKESRQGVGPFAERDRRTLGLFANQAAIALERARLHQEALEKERLEREMELASEIQSQILPSVIPHFPGHEVVAWSKPARHVGGDYFDLLTLSPDTMAVVVADVTGKGVPASLLVSTLHAAIRLLLDRLALGDDLMRRMNEHLIVSSAPNKFATLIAVELSATHGRFAFVNAGHNPGLVIRAGGAEPDRLEACGPPLGILSGASFPVRYGQLDPGDLLCLYSDGITERLSRSGEEFGETRFGELLAELRHLPLEEVRVALEERLEAFADGEPAGDDQTVVLVRPRTDRS